MSQQINLFNPVFLKQEKLFSALAMVQGLGLICLGLAGLGGYSYYRVHHLRADAAAVANQLVAVQAELTQQAERDKPKEKNKALEQEIQAMEAKLNAQRRVLDFVQQGELGNTKGYSDYFRAFARQNMNGLWLTGFAIHGPGSDIRIDGRAVQPELIPAYIMGIKREPLFRGKSFATLSMRGAQVADTAKGKAAGAYVEFSLGTSDAEPDAVAAIAGGTK
ncbi:MAG: MSHA biogenesis protein MshI [Bacillota bacterium]